MPKFPLSSLWGKEVDLDSALPDSGQPNDRNIVIRSFNGRQTACKATLFINIKTANVAIEIFVFLLTPNHYPIPCWLILERIQWNLDKNTNIFSEVNASENTTHWSFYSGFSAAFLPCNSSQYAFITTLCYIFCQQQSQTHKIILGNNFYFTAKFLPQYWWTLLNEIENIPSNLYYNSHQIPKLLCFSSHLSVVFTQSTEARC